MAIDPTKTTEITDGLSILESLSDNQPFNILSGTDSPQGLIDADISSVYYQKNGNVWVKTTAGVSGWINVKSLNNRTGISVTTLLSSSSGVSFNSTTYEFLASQILFGLSDFNPLVQASLFLDVDPGAGTSTAQIRLFNTVTQLPIVTVTETGDPRRTSETTFTLPATDQNIELQALQTGAQSGTLYRAAIIYRF